MWSEVVDELVALVPAGATAVDIGIGTGAIGGRLAARGLTVVGVDVNRSMLAALRELHPAVPVVLGDAAALPIHAAAADLVVMACVLHLVDDWRAALAEAARIAVPHGVLAINVGQSALAGRTGISRFFVDAVRARVDIQPIPGPSSSDEVAAELARHGLEPMGASTASGFAPRTVRDHIFRLEWNPFAWPPGVPQWALSEAAAAMTTWAFEAFGSLDEVNDTPVSVGFALFGTPRATAAAVEHDVCRLDQLVEGRGWPAKAAGRYLAVFLDRGRVHVLENQCAHAGSPLDGGAVRDGRVQCPWHGWVYDLSTGTHLTVFGDRPGVPSYPCRVVDGVVKVTIEASHQMGD